MTEPIHAAPVILQPCVLSAAPHTGKFNIYPPVYQLQDPHACVFMKVTSAAWVESVPKCLLSEKKLCNQKLDIEIITITSIISNKLKPQDNYIHTDTPWSSALRCYCNTVLLFKIPTIHEY